MQLPEITMAGRFTAPEKFRQHVKSLCLTLHLSGLASHKTYPPDRKLVSSITPNDLPCMTLGFPNMSVDFEYGSNRENIVVMMDFPYLKFNTENKKPELDYRGKLVTLHNTLKLNPQQAIPVKEAFLNIIGDMRSGVYPRIKRVAKRVA